MYVKSILISLLCLFFLAGCNAKNDLLSKNGKSAPETANHSSNSTTEKTNLAENTTNDAGNTETKAFEPDKNQPKTVRDFFTLLPSEYFALEGCERTKDKNCDRARAEYLKTFLEVEDTANGYMKGGCDGAQMCFTLALFKRPTGKYLIALNTEFETGSENTFLDYSNGEWTDISLEVIPQFSKKNLYELPRKGTTIQVFAKKFTPQGDEDGKGTKLYDLEWKDGKFAVKK